MSDIPSWWLVVPAAGNGQRMKAQLPKQYLPMGGDQPMLAITLARFANLPGLQGVVLALAENDSRKLDWLPDMSVPVLTVTGGVERSISVRHALTAVAALDHPKSWVLVHDAARPCVRPEDVLRLLTLGSLGDGGILGTPVRDTMKRVSADGVIETTVSRERLYHALTPQMFRLGPLMKALDSAHADGFIVTDEASAMERLGYRPRLVEGSPDNIKVTYPEDLALAIEILRAQGVLPADLSHTEGVSV